MPLILLGAFIDLLQAGLSVALASIAAAPGSFLGAAGGCATGSWIFGQIGCWVGGLILTVAGTAANPFLAPITIPLGIMLGFVLSVCLSLTLGVGLISLLGFNDMFYPKYWVGGIGEVLPGLSVIPFWTGLTILCVLRKNAEEGEGLLATAGRTALSGLGLSSLRKTTPPTTSTPRNTPTAEVLAYNTTQTEESNTQVEAEPRRTRAIMSDIRPAVKTEAAAAPRAANDNDASYKNLAA